MTVTVTLLGCHDRDRGSLARAANASGRRRRGPWKPERARAAGAGRHWRGRGAVHWVGVKFPGTRAASPGSSSIHCVGVKFAVNRCAVQSDFFGVVGAGLLGGNSEAPAAPQPQCALYVPSPLPGRPPWPSRGLHSDPLLPTTFAISL